MITSARNTDAQKLADVLEDYLRNVRQLDELNVTGKECTGVDFTGGGKCDGTVKFEGENTYGKPARRRPNFVLRIRPSEDDKKEKQFARPEHVDQILNYLEKKDEEKPEIPVEQLKEYPTR